MACCSGTSTSPTAGSLVKKTKIEWHHTENCQGHSDVVEKVTFELEGHEMWLLMFNNRDVKTVVHSPDCPKCGGDVPESSTTTETKSDDYWGW